MLKFVQIESTIGRPVVVNLASISTIEFRSTVAIVRAGELEIEVTLTQGKKLAETPGVAVAVGN